MSPEKQKRKLAAVLSTDAAGYSRLMGQDEARTLATLEAHFHVMTSRIDEHRGRVVATHGESLLAEFASVVDALQCAVEIQNDLTSRNEVLPEKSRMHFRIGINVGDVVEEEGNLSGDGVNVAARMGGLADGGEICISQSAYEQVRGKVNARFESLGEHRIQNAAFPVRAYRVLVEAGISGKVVGNSGLLPYLEKRLDLIKVVVLALSVLVGIAGLWHSYYRSHSKPVSAASVQRAAIPLPDKPSIAVLPFENMTGDPKQEYFTDGFTEQIITTLSKISSLFVISRNSAFTYKGKPVKVQQVSEELGVRYVLEGSIQKSGERVRINAQLVDALSGQHVWADSYDRDLRNIFSLQDEITMKLLTALQVNLTSGEQARVWAKGTRNLAAYLKVMEARECLIKGNAAANVRARELAEEAIVLDPRYAKAFAYMGSSHVMDFLLYSSPSPKESLRKAVECLTEAVSKDESLADAHARLAHAYTFVNRHEEAIAEAEKAMALEPNSAEVQHMACLVLRFSGRPADAVSACKRAIRLEPFTPGLFYGNLGMAYFQKGGECEEAVKACEEGLKRAPDSMIVHFMATTVFSACGKGSEARNAAKGLLRINPKFSAESFAAKLPYKDPKQKEPVVEALRKAGL